MSTIAAIEAVQHATRAAQLATKQDPMLVSMSKQAAVLAAKTELGQNFKTKRDAIAALEWANKSTGGKALSMLGTGVNAVANNKVMMAAGRVAPAVFAANALYRGFTGYQADGARGAGRGVVEASIPFANKLGVLSFYDKVFGGKGEPAGRPMITMEANAGGAALTTGDKTTNAIVTQAAEGKAANPFGAGQRSAPAPAAGSAQSETGGKAFEAANKTFSGSGKPTPPIPAVGAPDQPGKRRGWSNAARIAAAQSRGVAVPYAGDPTQGNVS